VSSYDFALVGFKVLLKPPHIVLQKDTMQIAGRTLIRAAKPPCMPVPITGVLAHKFGAFTKACDGDKYGRRWALAAASLATPEGEVVADGAFVWCADSAFRIGLEGVAYWSTSEYTSIIIVKLRPTSLALASQSPTL
jgi:hypothetical protein